MARNKYNAKRTQRDGFTFDSKWEADRYSELRLLELAGEISVLDVKPDPYELHGSYINPRTGKLVKSSYYQIDFAYKDREGRTVYEDAKGVKRTESVLKRKIVEAKYGIAIWFVFRDGRAE